RKGAWRTLPGRLASAQEPGAAARPANAAVAWRPDLQPAVGHAGLRSTSRLEKLSAFAITSLARMLTGARSLWLGCAPVPTQRIYFANHSSHGDFVLLWASLPPELRARTRPVAGADYWQKSGLRRYIINKVFNG